MTFLQESLHQPFEQVVEAAHRPLRSVSTRWPRTGRLDAGLFAALCFGLGTVAWV